MIQESQKTHEELLESARILQEKLDLHYPRDTFWFAKTCPNAVFEEIDPLHGTAALFLQPTDWSTVEIVLRVIKNASPRWIPMRCDWTWVEGIPKVTIYLREKR